MTRFFITYRGKELGVIEANNYEEARARIEEVIKIEEEEDTGILENENL